MTLQEWLRRENRTDSWLAAKLGVHRSTITRIRNNRRAPSVEVAAKIQKLSGFQVTAADYGPTERED